jgi:hypothetical protein
MTIAEQIRQIMLSEELSDAEKLDRLYAIIPADSCKIDKLSQATPAQLRQLKEAIAVAEACSN